MVEVLPQFSFTTSQWTAAENDINNIRFDIRPKIGRLIELIVRSSSFDEDGDNGQ